jgi:uncharacterized membrane protein
MDVALEIALLWAAFTASHVGLSSLRVRPRLVGAIGELAFLGLYSVIALAIFVPLMWLFFTHKHEGPALWLLPRGPLLSWTLYLAMVVALVLLVASFVNPSPAGMAPTSATPRGVHWLTRHPLVMAFVVFSLAHLLPNGFASDVAFFGGFAAFALLAAAHQDHRKRIAGPAGYAEFAAATPFFPFTGNQTARGLRELSKLALVGGILLAILIRYFHSSWFGGNP